MKALDAVTIPVLWCGKESEKAYEVQLEPGKKQAYLSKKAVVAFDDFKQAGGPAHVGYGWVAIDTDRWPYAAAYTLNQASVLAVVNETVIRDFVANSAASTHVKLRALYQRLGDAYRARGGTFSFTVKVDKADKVKAKRLAEAEW